MKKVIWLQRGINEVYARTHYDIINPGGRAVRSKSKRIAQEIPDDRRELLHIRSHNNN